MKSHDIKLSVISSEAARILSKGVTSFKLLMTYLLHLRSTGIQNPEVSLLPEHLNCLPELKKKIKRQFHEFFPELTKKKIIVLGILIP